MNNSIEIPLPEGTRSVEVFTPKTKSLDGGALLEYQCKSRISRARKTITLKEGQGIYISRKNDALMVGYFAKQDGFKWWEMRKTICRLDAMIEAVKYGYSRTELETEYRERKRKQKAA